MIQWAYGVTVTFARSRSDVAIDQLISGWKKRVYEDMIALKFSDDIVAKARGSMPNPQIRDLDLADPTSRIRFRFEKD